MGGAAAARLSWAQVRGFRLARQRLDARAPRDEMLDVAAALGGVHAQVMSSAELTLWARVDGLGSKDVAGALWDERALVKTWAMRGTLHLLPAREYAMWQAGLATYAHWRKPGWARGFNITPADLEQLLAVTGAALREAAPLTREALAAEVGRRTGSAAQAERLRDGFGPFLKPASFLGELCFAPSEGRNVRFTSPQSWLGAGEPIDPQTPLREVARRFLAAHGPATRDDLGRWWGVQPAPAGRMIAALGEEVAEVDVEGEPRWALTADLDALQAADPRGTVNLLPAFDQYVIGSTRHAERLLPDASLRGRVHRPQAWVSPVLLVDGRMDGVWRHELKGSRLTVEIEPFARVAPRARRAAEEEAERLASFAGGAAEVSWIGANR